jgi:hypothetical protein
MLIALLLALGVDLIVIVAFVAVVVGHKRRLLSRPGTFRGAARVVSGEIDGLRPKWNRGAGRWVHGVLIWTRGPLFFRTELLPTDAALEQRPAGPDEVKRLGDHPSVVKLAAGPATLEVAAAGESATLLLGPHDPSVDAQVS